MRSTTSPRRTCTRSCTRSTRRSRRRGRPSPTGTRSTGSRSAFSRLAERHLGVARDLVAAPLLHDTPRRDRPAAGRGARLAGGRVRAGPGPDDAQADRGRARLPARRRAAGRRSGRCSKSSARQIKGASWKPMEEVAELRAEERRGARRRRRRAPVAGARRAGVRGDPGAVGHHATGGWRVEGFRSMERAHRRAAGRSRRAAGRRPDHLSRTRRCSRGR